MKSVEFIIESDEVSLVASLCQRWLDGGRGMTKADFATILQSSIAQDCKINKPITVYRAIAPSAKRVKSFLKTKTITFKSNNPVVAYSMSESAAQAAAEFTKSGDEITLVFKKVAPPTDILLNFSQLLQKLRALGSKFSHSEDDDELEVGLTRRINRLLLLLKMKCQMLIMTHYMHWKIRRTITMTGDIDNESKEFYRRTITR
jgi:hypothetical protein